MRYALGNATLAFNRYPSTLLLGHMLSQNFGMVLFISKKQNDQHKKNILFLIVQAINQRQNTKWLLLKHNLIDVSLHHGHIKLWHKDKLGHV